jgi:hypothetical protein
MGLGFSKSWSPVNVGRGSLPACRCGSMWQIAREGDGAKISLAFGFAFAIRVEQLEYGIVVPPAGERRIMITRKGPINLVLTGALKLRLEV